MRYWFVLLLLVSQGVVSQGREVIDGVEYNVTQLLLDAGKGGIGLGAIEKKNNYQGRAEMEIVSIDGPDVIVNGVNLGPRKSLRVDVYRFVNTGSGTRRVLAREYSQSRPLEIGEIEVWGYYPGGTTTATYKVILPARVVPPPPRPIRRDDNNDNNRRGRNNRSNNGGSNRTNR